MNLFALLLYVLPVHGLGAGVLALLFPIRADAPVKTHAGGSASSSGVGSLTLPERYGLAGCLGMILVYFLSILQLSLHRPIALPVFFIFLGLFWAIALAQGNALLDRKGLRNALGSISRSWRWRDRLLLAAILAGVLLLFGMSLWWPVTRQDAWAQWVGNAKYLFFHGRVDRAYFQETNLSGYPLFLMANEIVLCRLRGAWSEFLPQSCLVVPVSDFLLVLYATVRAWSGRTLSLLAAFFALGIPLFASAGRDGTAELYMAVFLAISAIAFLRHLRSDKTAAALLTGLLAGTLAVVKSEGLFALFLMTAVFFIFAKRANILRLRVFFYWPAPAVLLYLPWLYLKAGGYCLSTRLETVDLSPLGSAGALFDILKTWIAFLLPFGSERLAVDAWRNTFPLGPTFLFSLLFFLFRNRGDRSSRVLFAMIASLAALYAAGSLATGWPDQYPRLLTQAAGLVLLFSFRQAAVLFGAGPAGGREENE
ncbi:MAG: glycosyltransferase family 39 protein [Planctomycetota bacterium]